MKELGRVLIVDDDPDMVAVLRSTLEYEGFRVESCHNLNDMKTKVRQYSFDGILLDLFLGDENGVEAIPYLIREAPFSCVIVMSAYGSIEVAVEAMQRGAASFVPKTDDPKRIVDLLKQRLQSPAAPAPQSSQAPFNAVGMFGQSVAMQALYDEILRFKDTDVTVLICGESGTGKELVARAIHQLSPRAESNFEALNCAAIPENLLESELFGYRKGAFTDAKTDRKGIFEVCSNGTLLLDEIGEMSLSLQAKLLRVIQEKEVLPVGASRSIKISTRIIAATNRDLEEEVARGRFREDLFFRLSVVPMFIPPLRDRREDIPILTEIFINRFNDRYGKRVRVPNRETIVRLMAFDWPGNVRQLQNAVERAVVLARDEEVSLTDILPVRYLKKKESEVHGGVLTEGGFSYASAKEAFEKSFLVSILKAAKGSIAEAARLSGRYRSDIYRLMERYHINVDEFK